MRYHGILAHNARDRSQVVTGARDRPTVAHGLLEAWGLARASLRPPSTFLGGALMAPVFAPHVTACTAFGGQLRLIAALTDPASVRRYLQGV